MPSILVNDVSPVVSYVATASQTLFSVPFEFFNVADIVVERDGSILTYNPTPVNNMQYSIVGANVEGGGSITLGGAGALAGDIIIIYRDIAIERLANYPETGPMAVRSLNAEQAKHIGMMQQLERDVSRSVVAPINETLNTLPDSETRAGKFFAFDVLGQPSVATPAGDDDGFRTDAGAPGGSALVGFVQSGTGAVTRSAQAKMRDSVSVEDFGAVGDGVETSPGVWTGTNDTVALQAAATWFRSTPGAHLTFSKGKNYLIYNRFDITGASHATITGNGASLIQMSNNHTIFCIPGVSGVSDFSTEPVIDMVGNYDAGATEIVLTSVANIVVGDYLWVRSRQTILFSATPVRQPVAEIVIVKSKDAGTNTITLEYPLSKDYIKDTVNLDPVTGLLYPHGVVLAENFARITAEYLTIDNLNVIDTAGVLKFAVFLWQIFRCNLIDMAVDAGNGFVVRGAFINMIRLQGKITAVAPPTYRANYAIALDTGTSHCLIDTPYLWSDNAFPYLHLHEGLSDIEVRGGTFLSATDTPIALGGGFTIGVCQITGGCWGIRLTGQTFINSPTPVSGLVHGVRVSNNETLMPGGIKGVVIEHTKFFGNFNGSPIITDSITGGGVDVIAPDVTYALTSEPWLISIQSPTSLLFEPRGDFTKIRNIGSRSRTYMRDKMMQLADFATVSNQGPLITGRAAGQGAPPLWWENTSTNNNFNLVTDLNGNLIFNSGGTPGASLGTSVGLFATNSVLTNNQDTNFWLLTRIGGVNTLKKVTMDAADSAGVGFRGLRVTN